MTKSAIDFCSDQEVASVYAARNMIMARAVLAEFPMATTNCDTKSPRFYVDKSNLSRMTRFDPKHASEVGGIAYDVLYTEVTSDVGPVRVYVSAVYDLVAGFERYYVTIESVPTFPLVQALMLTVPS